MDVLVDYQDAVQDREGRTYVAQACGRERDDGLWEGWLEFTAADGSVLRTDRETTQPNRDDLLYWAGGLTHAYLDGALLRVSTAGYRIPSAGDLPGIERAPVPASPAGTAAPTAVLDPYAVYAEGPDVLHGQLGALHEPQLRNIIRAYGLADDGMPALETMSRAELAALIEQAVERRAT